MPRTWVAIDFETATRERASACALGLAVIERDRIIERRSWLIRPPHNRFEYMNTRVHGIDAARVANEPGFEAVWPEIEPYLTDTVVLAHNAPFDMGVLRASLTSHHLYEPPAAGYHCTVTMSRRVWPHLPNHQLPTVCHHCGIALNHHDAASDAEACASIALRCLQEWGASSLDDLVEVLGMRAGAL